MGQQGLDGLGGLGDGQLLEEVIEIGPGLQAIGLGGFDEAVQQGAGLCPSGTTGKQPVFPSDHEGPDGVLRLVVVDLKATVLQKGGEDGPLSQGIADGLAEQSFGQGLFLLLVQPGLDGLEDRRALFLAYPCALLWVGLAEGALHRIELADVGDHRVGGGGVLASLGRVDELAPHVRPTAGVTEHPRVFGQGFIDRIAMDCR